MTIQELRELLAKEIRYGPRGSACREMINALPALLDLVEAADRMRGLLHKLGAREGIPYVGDYDRARAKIGDTE